MVIKAEKHHRSIRYRVLLKSGSVIRSLWEKLQQTDRLRESECPRRTVNKKLLFSLRSINVLIDMREYFQNFHKNNGKFLLWNKTKGITCPLREKFDFQGLPRFSGTVGTIGSCHHFLTKNRTCSQLKLGPARKHERIKYVDQPKFSRDFYVLIFLVNNKELYCITER